MKFFHKIIKFEHSEGVMNNIRQTTIKNHFFTPTKKKFHRYYILLKLGKHFIVSSKIKNSRTAFCCPPLSALESLLAKVI